MKRTRKDLLIISLIVITISIGWLLNHARVLGDVNWIWVLGLIAGGAMILLFGRLDKVTVIIGPFLPIAALFSLLRQSDKISVDGEAPCLLLTLGLLGLISYYVPLPTPDWIKDESVSAE